MSRGKALAAALFAALCLPALLWGLASTRSLNGPHPFLVDETQCDMCHLVTWKGSTGTLDEKAFSHSLIEVCNRCHKERIGRSHPVGMDPYKKIPRSEYPANFPLQWSDDLMADVMTCATCHNLHGNRFDDKKLYARQQPHPEGAGRYLTYFLRVRGDTPRQGYAPLCKACHPGY